jgi:hypothetical protein
MSQEYPEWFTPHNLFTTEDDNYNFQETPGIRSQTTVMMTFLLHVNLALAVLPATSHSCNTNKNNKRKHPIMFMSLGYIYNS